MEKIDEMLLAAEKDFENGDYVTNEVVLEYLSKVEESESWEPNTEVSDYFAKRAQDEIDRMWASGELTDEKLESFRTLHERTPYK